MANDKVTWTELRKAVAQMAGTSEQEAGVFLNALLEAMMDGLKTDKQVKIKGIGTFSLKPVAPRKSVNIATGEEIIIEGYNKITFNAEALLKESIEKRIEAPTTAQVVADLNADPLKKLGEQAGEIVDILADLGQAPTTPPVAEEEKEVKAEATAATNEKKAKKRTKKSLEQTTNEEVVTVEKPQEQELPAVVTEVKETENNTPLSVAVPKTPKKKSRWWIWLIITIILAGCAGTVWYYYEDLYDMYKIMFVHKPVQKPIVIEVDTEPSSTVVKYTTTYERPSKEAETKVSTETVVTKVNSESETVVATQHTGITPSKPTHESIVASEEVVKTEETSVEIAETTIARDVPLASIPRVYDKYIAIEVTNYGSRLTWMAYKHYGHKDLWVYIFEANKSKLRNPNYIKMDQEILIPALDARYTNLDDPEARALVDNLTKKYLK